MRLNSRVPMLRALTATVPEPWQWGIEQYYKKMKCQTRPEKKERRKEIMWKPGHLICRERNKRKAALKKNLWQNIHNIILIILTIYKCIIYWHEIHLHCYVTVTIIYTQNFIIIPIINSVPI